EAGITNRLLPNDQQSGSPSSLLSAKPLQRPEVKAFLMSRHRIPSITEHALPTREASVAEPIIWRRDQRSHGLGILVEIECRHCDAARSTGDLVHRRQIEINDRFRGGTGLRYNHTEGLLTRGYADKAAGFEEPQPLFYIDSTNQPNVATEVE